VQERFLKQRNGIDWLGGIFPYSNLRDRVSLVYDYLRILRSIDAVPEILFSAEKGTKISDTTNAQELVTSTNATSPVDLKKEETQISAPSTVASTEDTVKGKDESKGKPGSGGSSLFE
jgi:hypothetical protein